MISKTDITRLIAKYALLLIIFYLIQFLFSHAIDYYIKQIEAADMSKFWISNISTLIFILLNIITALIVRSDIKRLKLKSKYLIFLTLVWRPIGICLFFITLLNQTEEE